MRFIHPIVTAGLALGLVVFAGAEADKKTQAKQKSTPASKAVAKPAVLKTSGSTAVSSPNRAPKSATAKTATPKLAAAKKISSTTTTQQTATRFRRSVQQQPSSDRYKEIQQALGEKGYFSGSADGSWGPDSIEALKRFQRDQNLPDDGKIGSLSLIALGLGPKHEPAETQIGSGSALP